MLLSGVNVLHWQRNLENKTVIDVYYRPQRSSGKVIFSQACVILFTGGGVWSRGGVSNFSGGSPIFLGWGVWSRRGVSNFSRGGGGWGLSGGLQIFFSLQFSPPQKILLGCTTPPPTETVNARVVRILLECILVRSCIVYYHPQTKLREGNVFTPVSLPLGLGEGSASRSGGVCLWVQRGGWGSVSLWVCGCTPPRQTPPADTAPYWNAFFV